MTADRYIEVWKQCFFPQFLSDGSGNYTELLAKKYRQRYGLGASRRLVCQGVDSIFDVDTLMNITNKVSVITGAKYGQSQKTDVSLRVVTDHIRSSTLMLCAGVLPSNDGRGYVVRRIRRRAARHGKLLGVTGTFLWEDLRDRHRSEQETPTPNFWRSRITFACHQGGGKNFNKTIDSGMSILYRTD